jgi:hypothetical protein
MPGPLVVGAEGVLLLPDKDAYASSRPIEEGLELVYMLREFPTSVVIIICHTEDQEAAEYFMRMQALPKARVVTTAPEDRSEHAQTAQWHAINRERARGPVNLVLTAFREVHENCLHNHQTSLLFGRKGALAMLETQIPWEDQHERVKMTKEARINGENDDEHS